MDRNSYSFYSLCSINDGSGNTLAFSAPQFIAINNRFNSKYLAGVFLLFLLMPLLGLVFGYGLLFSINLLHRILKNVDGIGSGDFLLLGGIGSTFWSIIYWSYFIDRLKHHLMFIPIKREKRKRTAIRFWLRFWSNILLHLICSNFNTIK